MVLDKYISTASLPTRYVSQEARVMSFEYKNRCYITLELHAMSFWVICCVRIAVDIFYEMDANKGITTTFAISFAPGNAYVPILSALFHACSNTKYPRATLVFANGTFTSVGK